jgi:hypothetical protein
MWHASQQPRRLSGPLAAARREVEEWVAAAATKFDFKKKKHAPSSIPTFRGDDQRQSQDE